MSYQVLARKWRPKTFSELVGQQHVLQALVHALEHNRLHHAYLFTGTRGVGKTTIARILARALNCEQGVSPTPCGQCSACQEINDGRFVDLIEVDAASRTKVEDTRELLDNVQYAPSKGRYKVYLIDEVHMLSAHSFNALLKTLEEPPEHVKFLFATTDPQKLPVTVLSRCLQFNLRNMTPAQVADYLADILSKEAVGCDQDALALLANAAQGSMRDALSLTDQAIAYGRGEVRTERVVEMLGTIDRGRVVKLVKTLLAQDAQALFEQIAQVASMNPDYEQVIDETLRLLHQLSLAQAVPSLLRHDEKQAELEAMLASTSAEDLQLFYQCGLVARRDLALAPDPRIGFEMAFLRMLAFVPKLQGPQRVASINAEVAAKKPLADQPQPQSPLASEPETQPSAEALTEAELSAADSAEITQPEAEPHAGTETLVQGEEVVAPPTPVPPQAAPAEPLPELSSEPSSEPVEEPLPEPLMSEAPSQPQGTPDDFVNVWQTQFNKLGLQGMLESMVHDGELRASTQGWQLILAPDQQPLWSDERTQALAEVLAPWLAGKVLSVDFDEQRPNTPKKWQAEQFAKRKAHAYEVLQNDDFVQALQTQYNATLDQQSITPTESEDV